MHPVTTRILDSFDAPGAGPQPWSALLASAATRSVFQTRHWQHAWWRSFARGQLMLVVAERDGKPLALAPLFADGGMLFFVGSGGSDYLDFLGETTAPGVLEALLDTALQAVPGCVGLRFYHVPDASPTGERLQDAARRLGMACHDEGTLPAPVLDLAGTPGAVPEAAGKKSLVRHERYFRREGSLSVLHLRRGAEILPHLDRFFDQHVERWAVTPYPSLFLDPAQRAFYRRLTESADDSGGLRFTRVDWNGLPVAFHYGFHHDDVFLWYKPSFDISLARRSPGEVLLRQLLLAAGDECAASFDFGLGDEAFKRRFATRVPTVRTWGLYPGSGGRPQ